MPGEIIFTYYIASRREDDSIFVTVGLISSDGITNTYTESKSKSEVRYAVMLTIFRIHFKERLRQYYPRKCGYERRGSNPISHNYF